MTDGLGVVPNMRAGTCAAAVTIAAAFPAPESAVVLAKNGRRLEDRHVRRDRFDHFRREIRVVKRLAEPAAAFLENVVLFFPEMDDSFDTIEPCGVPRDVMFRRGGGSSRSRRNLPCYPA